MILYGDIVATKLLQAAKAKTKTVPQLAIIVNRDDEAGLVYVKNKVRACQLCGFDVKCCSFDKQNTESNYIEKIKEWNNDNNVNGIIIQLPLANKNIDETKILELISPEKDIDGFGKLSNYPPCTPAGIIKLVEYYKGQNWFAGKNAVIIGRSNIVGKPMAKLLLDKDCTVTVCHSKTKDISQYTKNADLVVVAVGTPKFLKKDMVKQGATIIDVGINRTKNGICGDADFEELKDICDITPVPKGVGPMTVAELVSRLPQMKEAQRKNIEEKMEI